MALVRICHESEVSPGQAVKIVIEGHPIALVKDSAGTIHAIGDTCSHGEISLSEGFVEGDTLECWAHGSKFELATGKPQNFPAFDPVPVYPVTITDGDIFIDPSVTLEIS
jgi:3-phenylpropionate/trans-cinnamate dioxygenase ferredoxin subunit